MEIEITGTEIYEILRNILNWLLVVIGYYRIFQKCGVKGFWAFVPFAREYHVSLCADKEEDGRTYTILSVILTILGIPLILAKPGTNSFYVLAVSFIAISVALLIYFIRIYLGLCSIFQRRKKWVVLFVFFDGITAMIWGFSESFQPKKKVFSVDAQAGAKIRGLEAASTDSDLTVNIEDRTVIDFFRKKTLLKDLHLTIPTGHMVLLLGGSGAGKTTFVNAVTGYERQTQRSC